MTELSDVAIPLEFGGSWAAFVEEWCLGGAVGHDIDKVSRALTALTQHWPTKVERLVGESSRGLWVVASAIELGLLLDSSEAVEGFPGVLHRLIDGQRSAYSELVVVASLQRLGYEPRFDAHIDGSVLDATCDIDGSPVYFEVVAPEPSDASADERRRIEELTVQLRGCVSKCRVEIEIYGPLC